ncbi:MAG: N-acetylmuramoyl-L-alanine amidase family protein [Candidatus Rifleibacteriota bacterium]
MIRSKLTFLLLFFLVATCSSALTLQPLKGVTVLLDPGHGGTDPGAIGPSGLKESDTNLRVAKYLKTLLEADGAEVFMTRENDRALTLGERVEIASRLLPDLFVSVHHNASLKPRKTNRSEIYYNALDQGLSQRAGQFMIDRLESFGFGEESLIVPGGFFVLRNNPAPSVLTEGSYISIPEIEKQLKTGKALTNQAEALRRAIRETFSNGPLKIKLFLSETPVKIDTPYFNFIFTASKPVTRVRARLTGAEQPGFGFDLLPPIGNTYRLYNSNPLKSGEYELQLTFYAKDGTVAPRISLPLSVNLPFGKGRIRGVAPYVPAGFCGKFPVIVDLHDPDGNLNQRSVPLAIFYGNNQELITKSDADGRSLILLDLKGDEKHPLEVRAVHDSEILAQTFIPVRKPERRFVLGKVMMPDQTGLAGVRIDYGLKYVITEKGGYFFIEYPMIYDNMKLNLAPPPGFAETETWIKTSGVPVFYQNIALMPVSANLLGKKIAVMAPAAFDPAVKSLIDDLNFLGAGITKLSMPENMAKPEYQAVLEINLDKSINLVISLKPEKITEINARHYHRGGKGKTIADLLAKEMLNSPSGLKINVTPGSDYEISHTGATSMVLAFPEKMPPGSMELVLKHLVKILKSSF